jgi:hypothetical protein
MMFRQDTIGYVLLAGIILARLLNKHFVPAIPAVPAGTSYKAFCHEHYFLPPLTPEKMLKCIAQYSFFDRDCRDWR